MIGICPDLFWTHQKHIYSICVCTAPTARRISTPGLGPLPFSPQVPYIFAPTTRRSNAELFWNTRIMSPLSLQLRLAVALQVIYVCIYIYFFHHKKNECLGGGIAPELFWTPPGSFPLPFSPRLLLSDRENWQVPYIFAPTTRRMSPELFWHHQDHVPPFSPIKASCCLTSALSVYICTHHKQEEWVFWWEALAQSCSDPRIMSPLLSN